MSSKPTTLVSCGTRRPASLSARNAPSAMWSLPQKIAELRKVSDLPVAVGFGISNPEQAREVAQHADAVVLGSAIVDLIAKQGNKPEMFEKVSAFARELAKAIH